jgi:hypothetical protein
MKKTIDATEDIREVDNALKNPDNFLDEFISTSLTV